MNIHFERIAQLREMMAEHGWDAVVLSSSDPHNSEYPAPRWQQMEWLSGFTGEAGEIVVTQWHAGLWTDSRYYIQAAAELDGSGVELHKAGQPGVDDIPTWLIKCDFLGGPKVAVDALCCTVSKAESLLAALRKAWPEAEIVSAPDLLSGLWAGRPQLPVSPVITLSEENVGQSRHDKLTELRKFMMMNDCDAIFISTLDDIAWLLNIRGSDIEYNPYVISYLFVSQSETVWFAKKSHSDPDLFGHDSALAGSGSEWLDQDTADSFQELELDGVTVAGYDEVASLISSLTKEEEDFVILANPDEVNLRAWHQLEEVVGKGSLKPGNNPVKLWKSVKNQAEIEFTRTAYLEDGTAMETFLFWLENQVKSGREVTEWEASEKLTSLRAAIPGYRGNSFANISAYGPNAALPHYCVPEVGSATICPSGLYLVDSGGQYIFGTTDITRTVPMGECTYLEREDYTLVLKGMIALSQAVFPYGTAGCQIDVLARNALWRNLRNFGHGTGHGIGFYLGVHEGPQTIRQNFNSQPMLPGMITSNEPGIYREGLHGIRHENVILCVERESNEFGRWLSFETLTVCHIDTAPIIRELMTAEELEWLNAYNRSVFDRLSSRLDPEVAAWLKLKTMPL